MALPRAPGRAGGIFESGRCRAILRERSPADAPARCLECHGADKQEAGLRLDSREALLKGSDAEVVVVPGEPDKSPLIHAIRYEGNVQMPPAGKLEEKELALTDHVGQAGRSLGRTGEGGGGRNDAGPGRPGAGDPLGLSATRAPRSARGIGGELERKSDRSVHLRRACQARVSPLGQGGSSHPVAGADVRSDWLARHGGRSRRVRQRRRARRRWPRSSTGCWPRRRMGSGGDAIGSTSPATRIPRATYSPKTVAIPMPTRTGIMSSAH